MLLLYIPASYLRVTWSPYMVAESMTEMAQTACHAMKQVASKCLTSKQCFQVLLRACVRHTFQRMRATRTPSKTCRCSNSTKASRCLRSLRRRSWRSFSFSSAAFFSRCLNRKSTMITGCAHAMPLVSF